MILVFSYALISDLEKYIGKKLKIAPHWIVYEEKIRPSAQGKAVLIEILMIRPIRFRCTTAGGSAGTRVATIGIKPRVAMPMMNHQICHVISVALSSTAEIPTPIYNAIPWKAPHQPIAPLTLSGGARRRTMAGAVTVMRINPIPSIARVVISQAEFGENPPTRDAIPAQTKPTSRVFLAPMRSATTEAANPPSPPASCTTPTRAPAATRLMPRSARINSNAEGNFHTCIAARMPVATTTVHAREADPVVAITTKPTRRAGKNTRMRPSVPLYPRIKARCDHTSPREI